MTATHLGLDRGIYAGLAADPRPPPMRTFVNLVVGLSVALAAINPSFAAKNYLPDRDKPVPADQPVPTVDFVRPPLFGQPELSPDGKYFAALTKGEDLRSNLVVCEIATGKVVLTHVDVPFFSWISNEHLSLDWSENRVVKVSDPDHLLHVETVVPKYKFGLMADSGFLRASDRRTEPQLGRSQNRPQMVFAAGWRTVVLPDLAGRRTETTLPL